MSYQLKLQQSQASNHTMDLLWPRFELVHHVPPTSQHTQHFRKPAYTTWSVPAFILLWTAQSGPVQSNITLENNLKAFPTLDLDEIYYLIIVLHLRRNDRVILKIWRQEIDEQKY